KRFEGNDVPSLERALFARQRLDNARSGQEIRVASMIRPRRRRPDSDRDDRDRRRDDPQAPPHLLHSEPSTMSALIVKGFRNPRARLIVISLRATPIAMAAARESAGIPSRNPGANHSSSVSAYACPRRTASADSSAPSHLESSIAGRSRLFTYACAKATPCVQATASRLGRFRAARIAAGAFGDLKYVNRPYPCESRRTLSGSKNVANRSTSGRSSGTSG